MTLRGHDSDTGGTALSGWPSESPWWRLDDPSLPGARRSRRGPRSSSFCSAAAPRPTTRATTMPASPATGGWAARSRRRHRPRADQAGGVVDVASQSGGKDASGGTPVEQQKVISTGNVQLRADDVGQAIFDVRKVVDVHGGTISEDDTETDKDGDAFRSRMVLRIPTADFDDAMSELEEVAVTGLVQAPERGRDHPGPRHRRPGRGPAAQHRPDPGPLRQRHLDQGHRQRRGRALPPPGRPRLAAGAAALPRRPDRRCRPSRSRSSGLPRRPSPSRRTTTRPASCPDCPTAGERSRPSWSAPRPSPARCCRGWC